MSSTNSIGATVFLLLKQFKWPHLIGTIMAAPLGNKNSTKDKRIWGKIIKKLAVQEDHKRLHRVAETLFKKAEEGDLGCIRELGDRIDGRAEQTISGDSDQPINIIVRTGIED